jgi:quinoprotein glucose dehydrogenase
MNYPATPRFPGLAAACRGFIAFTLAVAASAASADDKAAAADAAAQPAPQAAAVDEHQEGTKYSALTQINTGNVANLEQAWVYHTGEVPPKKPKNSMIAFEDQPSLIDGNLVVCTTSRRLIALDPATGKQKWVFDPQDPKVGLRKCRGISHWVDSQAPAGSACKSRIFLGTADYRLIAIDADNGKRCAAFGDQGQVQLQASKPLKEPGEVEAASKPAIVGDVVVVGSIIGDNQRVDAPSGRVEAFDARSGKYLWQFDPIPHDPADPAMKTWPKGTGNFGKGNVWADMAVDQAHDLVYLPTTGTSDDFYGGRHPGDNHYLNSVVALQGSTGKVVWSYQLVHHDVYDYDVPTQPMLLDLPQPGGGTVPALVQNTKMGLVFVFNRLTGEPLVRTVERPVPTAGAAPGEALSPTQPFPDMPPVSPQGFSPDDAWGFTPIDKYLCRREVEKYNYGPIYTPPSIKGTVLSPSAGGGPNWGGGAYDPASHIMVVPSNRVPTVVQLIPRDQFHAGDGSMSVEGGGAMTFDNPGSPYAIRVMPLLSPLGSPCSKPPWAALTAVDLVTHKIVWEVPLGSINKLMPVSLPWEINLGTPGAGGPLITAGGLVFIGYTLDDTLRAFDLHTGKVLWKGDLPAAGTAMPVTYEINGEQYVVIPAGGHTMYGPMTGDAVVAFKLKH